MKIFLRRILTIKKPLLILAVLALLSIFFTEFKLNEIPEPIKGLSILRNIFIKFCFSYLSAFLFYFLISHLPNEKLKAKMFRFLNNKLFRLTDFGYRLLLTIHRHHTGNVPNDSIKADQIFITESLKKINPHNHITMQFFLPIQFENWFDALNYLHENSKEIIKDIFFLKDIIDIEILQSISHIEDLFQNHLNFTKDGNVTNSDLGFLSNSLFDYIKETERLRELMKTYSDKYALEFQNDLMTSRANGR
jgi:hypothetical protein